MWALREYDVPLTAAVHIIPASAHTEEETKWIEILKPEISQQESKMLLHVPGSHAESPTEGENRPAAVEITPEEKQAERARVERVLAQYTARQLADIIEGMEPSSPRLTQYESTTYQKPMTLFHLNDTSKYNKEEQNPLSTINNYNSSRNPYQRFTAKTIQALADVILPRTSIDPYLLPLIVSYQNSSDCNELIIKDVELGIPTCDNMIVETPQDVYKESFVKPLCHIWGSVLSGGIAGDLLELFVEIQNKENFNEVWKKNILFVVSMIKVNPNGKSSEKEVNIVLRRNEKKYSNDIYYAELMFREAGDYTMRLYYKSQSKKDTERYIDKCYIKEYPIGKSQYLITILPAEGFGPLCYIYGLKPNTNTFSITPGELKTVVVVSVDRFNNERSKGGDRVYTEAIGGTTHIEIKDVHDGSYEVTFCLKSDHVQSIKCSGLAIWLNGNHIKGSPFQLDSEGDQMEQKTLNTRPFNNIRHMGLLLNDPSLVDTYKEVLQHFELPMIPTCPPFPDLLLSKAALPSGFTSLLLPSIEHQLSKYEGYLKVIHSRLCDAWHHMQRDPLRIVERTEEAIAIQTKKLEGVKTACHEARNWMQKLQTGLERVYTCVQFNTVDTLPVEFKIDDVDSIKHYQKQEQQQLEQMQKMLAEQVESMRTREYEFQETRKKLISEISLSIRNKQLSIQNQVQYLNHLIHKIHKRNLRLLKNQKRREHRDASVPAAVEALQVTRIRRDLIEQILNSDLRMTKRSPELFAPKEKLNLNFDEHISRKPKITPTNPQNPAFWIAEGRMRKAYREAIVKVPANKNNECGGVYEHKKMVYCNPSMVTSVEDHFDNLEINSTNNNNNNTDLKKTILNYKNSEKSHHLEEEKKEYKENSEYLLKIKAEKHFDDDGISKTPNTGYIPPMKPPHPPIAPLKAYRHY